MKFDIFNKFTWTVDDCDHEKKLRNKANGAIGQKISELRALDAKIKEAAAKQKDQQDFIIAQTLLKTNETAHSLMKVHYHYPNENIQKVIENINNIIKIWTDKEGREHRWREIISMFENLKPYMRDGSRYYSDNRIDEELTKLTSIKVTGNAAWEVYRDLVKNNKENYWHDEWKKLKALLPSEDLADVDSIELDDEPALY